MVRIYEEYDSPREKRQAQRGAKRGIATGRARGYLFVFNEDGIHHTTRCQALYDSIGELFSGSKPGEEPHSMTHSEVSITYLRFNCRFIGFDSIPQSWKQAFAEKLDDCVVEENDPGCRKRYARYLKHSQRVSHV